MQNIINYYYKLYPTNIITLENSYFFNANNNCYSFELYKRPINDITYLYDLSEELMKNNILIHQIIKNNTNQIITYVNDKPYILMEISINTKAKVKLSEICFINNNSVNENANNALNRTNWINLWENKIDYFESQINEIGKKYPNLCTYANYYIGLAENAILYIKEINNIDGLILTCACHKRININDTYYELYHPTSFIYDFRVRDACEYIKSCFFNKKNAYEIVEEYFQMNYLSYKEALLFYGRLIYPSYFFDLYDDIINLNLKETEIEKIVTKAQEYEIFLINTHIYLSKLYGRYIPPIDWLIKKSINY